jgi:hypothetical protein
MATSTSSMWTSASLNASGYNLFQIFVVVNIVYMSAYSVRSHMFMNIVTSLLLLSFFGLNYSLVWLNFQQSKNVIGLCWRYIFVLKFVWTCKRTNPSS